VARALDRGVKILYVWDADYPWDVRTEKICAALTAAGHEVHIAARNREWRAVTESLPEGRVHRMPPWRWAGRGLDGALSFPAFFNPRWLRLLAGTIRRVRPDLVLVRDLPLCPTAIWAARRAGIPVMLDMAENYPAMIRAVWAAGRQRFWDVLARNPRAVAWVERWCLPRLDGVLVVVEESGERLRALGVPAERITVVSNTPSRDRVAASRPARPPGEVLRLVYLGLMEIPRGVGDLLHAVRRLTDGGLRVHLTLIGDGRDHALFQGLAAELWLEADTVTFLGRLPYEQALAIVEQADVGVVPHHADEAWNTTIPNKLFDYMAAGLAVVTSSAAPAARIVGASGAGTIFRSGDALDLARAVAELADPARRAACAASGMRAIRARYHWEQDAERLRGAIAGALSARAQGRPKGFPYTEPSTTSYGPQ
jgi:glycosyltransferase involved in cell wall biosynthesis